MPVGGPPCARGYWSWPHWCPSYYWAALDRHLPCLHLLYPDSRLLPCRLNHCRRWYGWVVPLPTRGWAPSAALGRGAAGYRDPGRVGVLHHPTAIWWVAGRSGAAGRGRWAGSGWSGLAAWMREQWNDPWPGEHTTPSGQRQNISMLQRHLQTLQVFDTNYELTLELERKVMNEKELTIVYLFNTWLWNIVLLTGHIHLCFRMMNSL